MGGQKFGGGTSGPVATTPRWAFPLLLPLGLEAEDFAGAWSRVHSHVEKSVLNRHGWVRQDKCGAGTIGFVEVEFGKDRRAISPARFVRRCAICKAEDAATIGISLM